MKTGKAHEPLGFVGFVVVRVTGLEPVTPTMSISLKASADVRHVDFSPSSSADFR
jgi:hypothetical protein